jgi:hypothetical protein
MVDWLPHLNLTQRHSNILVVYDYAAAILLLTSESERKDLFDLL